MDTKDFNNELGKAVLKWLTFDHLPLIPLELI